MESSTKIGFNMATNMMNVGALSNKVMNPAALLTETSGVYLLEAVQKSYNMFGTSEVSNLGSAAGSRALMNSYNSVKHIRDNTAVLVGGADTIDEIAPFTLGLRTTGAYIDDTADIYRVLDTNRRGACFSEGGAFMFLEDYDSAVSRGAPLLGEIVSAAYINSNRTLTVSSEGVAFVIRDALQKARVTPEEVAFVSLHATGTKRGDVTELAGCNAVFGGTDTMITSTKPTTGHMMAGSALVEVILSLRGLQEGVVPPTANLQNPIPSDMAIVGNKPEPTDKQYAISLTHGLCGHLFCFLLKTT
jgi:3-oxoacyl-[acyl-carrier-protein] synthase II